MKPETTKANNTSFLPPKAKLPKKAGDGVYVETEELSTATYINDIKNPLTNINMAVEMLASMSVGEDEKRCLEIILRSSNRIKSVVSELIKLQDASLKK